MSSRPSASVVEVRRTLSEGSGCFAHELLGVCRCRVSTVALSARSPIRSCTESRHVPNRELVASIARGQTKPVRIPGQGSVRSEEHTSELQSLRHLVCRLL